MTHQRTDNLHDRTVRSAAQPDQQAACTTFSVLSDHQIHCAEPIMTAAGPTFRASPASQSRLRNKAHVSRLA